MGKKIFIEPNQSADDVFASIQKLIPVNKRKVNTIKKRRQKEIL